MASYFRGIPDFDYVSRLPDAKISDYITVKNLFKRGKLREDIFGDLQYFTKYKIIGDERPDNVAYKIYGDETLDWVILLSNNILNIQTEWPLPQTAFDRILLERYGSYENLYSGIHHYETTELKTSSGEILLEEGIIINNSWSQNGNFIYGFETLISFTIYDAPTRTLTIIPQVPINNINVNDEIELKNFDNNSFNGKFTVKYVIVNPGTSLVNYLQCEIPNTTQEPILTGKEKIIYTPEQKYTNSNVYYYQYYDSKKGEVINIPSSEFTVPVTNYEYESKIEDDKRNIFLLKQNYLNVILNDVEVNYPYKEGGQQYINETLKKGENIRLMN
ncbi:MAG: Synechococcus phage [Bacteroidota bacterium]|jgi:hypothetical protein